MMASFLTLADYNDAYTLLKARKLNGVGPLLLRLRLVSAAKVGTKMDKLCSDYTLILKTMRLYMFQNLKDISKEELTRKAAQSLLKPYKVKAEDDRHTSKLLDRKVSHANNLPAQIAAFVETKFTDSESITKATKAERIDELNSALVVVSRSDFGPAVKEYQNCISDMKALNHNYRLRQSDVRTTLAHIEGSLKTTNSSALKYLKKSSSRRLDTSPVIRSKLVTTTDFSKAQNKASGVDIRSRRQYRPADSNIFQSMQEKSNFSPRSNRHQKSAFRLRQTKVYRSINLPAVGGSISLREFAVDSSAV